MEPFIYKIEQVQQLLTDFKEWTKQGNEQYRIPYSLWKDLSKAQEIVVYSTGEIYYKKNDVSTYAISKEDVDGEGLRQYFAAAERRIDSVMLDNTASTKNNTKYNLRKENNKMNNFIPNLTFGPLDNGSVAFSPYGIAVRCGNNWLTYDPVTAQTVDVTGFTFDLGKMIYKIPIAVKNVKPGDLIDHQRKLVYVTEVQDTKIVAVDLIASEEKTIIPLTNMFHFNFVTKIATLVNFNIGTPSADQPFGNIMPIIMWSTLLNNDDENGMDFGKLMMLSAMTGGQNPFSFMAPASNG